jgi:hypothetical protein
MRYTFTQGKQQQMRQEQEQEQRQRPWAKRLSFVLACEGQKSDRELHDAASLRLKVCPLKEGAFAEGTWHGGLEGAAGVVA